MENKTYCVRRVKAAEVIEDGRLRPLMISCHCFLLMTSTRPPRIVTRLYNSQRSNTCLAIIGRRLMGVPRAKHSIRNMMATTEIPCIFIIRFSRIQDCCCCMGLPGWTSRQSDTTWTVKSQLENSYQLKQSCTNYYKAKFKK